MSIHLWFWLSDKLGQDDLKEWADWVNAGHEFRIIDPAVFVTNQVHYTSAPVFEGLAATGIYRPKRMIRRRNPRRPPDRRHPRRPDRP
jgi:hypothetical protein